MPSHLDQYVQYIKNTGRIPLQVSIFDEDWEPIGKMVRKQLVEAGMVVQSGGGLYLPGDAILGDLGDDPQMFEFKGDIFGKETNEEKLRRTLEMIIEDIKFKKKLGLLKDELDSYIKLGEQTLKETKP